MIIIERAPKRRTKPILAVVFSILVSLLLLGCLGKLNDQKEQAEQGYAAARFDTFTGVIVAERGINTSPYPLPVLGGATIILTLLVEMFGSPEML